MEPSSVFVLTDDLDHSVGDYAWPSYELENEYATYIPHFNSIKYEAIGWSKEKWNQRWTDAEQQR